MFSGLLAGASFGFLLFLVYTLATRKFEDTREDKIKLAVIIFLIAYTFGGMVSNTAEAFAYEFSTSNRVIKVVETVEP